MNEVAIINYEMGNLKSINSACEKVGLKSLITDNSDIINKSKSLILPGVGAFNQAIKNIKRKNLYETIYKFYNSGKPIIGICLGMQILFERSEENFNSKGLGIIKGSVENIGKNKKKNNLINIGWREIKINKSKDTYLDYSNNKKKFYFIHKFICKPSDQKVILCESKFNNKYFCAAIKHKNIEAYQFHPEKSGIWGLNIYKNLKNKIR